jgi:hypothetical protein
MSRFYAEIQGNRGLASRQGSKNSGIWGHIRGWNSGVSIGGHYDEEEDTDVFNVNVTSGSGFGSTDTYIGKIIINELKEPEWIPAK